jgi:hypothetical protein
MPTHSLLALASRDWASAHFDKETMDVLRSNTAGACFRAEDHLERAELNAARACTRKELKRARTHVQFLAELLFESEETIPPRLAACVCLWNSIYRLCRAWTRLDPSQIRPLAAHARVYDTLIKSTSTCRVNINCRHLARKRPSLLCGGAASV